MDDGSQAEVVESDGVSVFQHNPFLWEVEGNAFKRADGLTASARYLATTIASWMARFTPEERGRFIDTLFGVIGGYRRQSLCRYQGLVEDELPRHARGGGRA